MKFKHAIFVSLLACAVANQAYALELSGWKGFVAGCGINNNWMIGNFNQADAVVDACNQAAANHVLNHNGPQLVLHSSKGTFKDNTARCYFKPKEGLCGLIKASPICPTGTDYVPEAEACFCGWAAKELNGKCVPGADCDEMVRRLKQLKVAQTDPRHGFYRNQTCIADKSCAARKDMEDKQWLNKVVPAFVNPLITKSGEWNKVIQGCKLRGTLPGLGAFWCQNEMATYHIEADLQKAINQHGCGTESDWKKVGDTISLCMKIGIKEDWPTSVLQEDVRDFADGIVQRTRNNIRATCLKQKG